MSQMRCIFCCPSCSKEFLRFMPHTPRAVRCYKCCQTIQPAIPLKCNRIGYEGVRKDCNSPEETDYQNIETSLCKAPLDLRNETQKWPSVRKKTIQKQDTKTSLSCSWTFFGDDDDYLVDMPEKFRDYDANVDVQNIPRRLRRSCEDDEDLEAEEEDYQQYVLYYRSWHAK